MALGRDGIKSRMALGRAALSRDGTRSGRHSGGRHSVAASFFLDRTILGFEVLKFCESFKS